MIVTSTTSRILSLGSSPDRWTKALTGSGASGAQRGRRGRPLPAGAAATAFLGDKMVSWSWEIPIWLVLWNLKSPWISTWSHGLRSWMTEVYTSISGNHHIIIWLVVNHGILNDFPIHTGNGIIIPTDFHFIIFFRGVETTNQLWCFKIIMIYCSIML